MQTLTSKIQYKDFEAGEFVREEKRTYEETIDLIEKFPWQQQRDSIAIGIDNPCVTIENNANEYLKLAPYFNEKYALYYLDEKRKLRVKFFLQYVDAFTDIKSFFDEGVNPDEFRPANSRQKNCPLYFITQDFHYTIIAAAARKYFFRFSWISLSFSVFCLLLIIKAEIDRRLSLNFTYGLICVMLLAGGGIHLVLFINHYLAAKNKLLIISRNEDVFYYGDGNTSTAYNKKRCYKSVLV